MRKGEQTRCEIVERAAPLFNQKGYEGMSMSDLMEATGLQKGGIYRHFSGKEELAGEAFDFSWERAMRVRQEGVEDVEDRADRLKKMISNFVERRTGLIPGGCPLMNTAVEADDGNAVLRERAKKALLGWISRLSKTAAEGIERKEIDADVNPEKLAQWIIGSLEGALLLSRLQKDEETLRNAKVCLDEYVEQKVRLKKKSTG